MEVVEGNEIFLAEMGTVVVRRIYPSGSAIVEDLNGAKWLCIADMFFENGISLLTTKGVLCRENTSKR